MLTLTDVIQVSFFKRLFIWLLGFTLLMSTALLVITSAEGSKLYAEAPPGSLIVSQGAPVTPYNGMVIHDGVQSNLTDGDLGTLSGASTGFIDLYLDLGRKKTLDYVAIHYARHWNKTNKVYVSDDAVNWTEVVSGDGGIGKYEYLQNTTTTNILDHNVFGAMLPANTKGRYVRISADQVYVNIYEIQVYSSFIEVEQFNMTGGVTMEVLPGFSVQMKAEAQPSNATNQSVTWSVEPKPGSSGMAVIDAATGFLTAITAGTVTVTAEALDGSGVAATTDIVIRESIEQWCSMELSLMSSKTYNDPFADVDVVATFTGPGGIQITRPAFWDGGRIWKVRFAPTVTGTWSMTVEADPSADDTGLNRSSAISFQATPYSGVLDLYKRGFLQIGDNDRHFNYNDGTPFFYLGDTHWFMPSERFEGSNVEGIDSQFKYAVDHRVSQGFTVYQSQPLYMTGNYLDVSQGIGIGHLERLQDIDQKFQYVADAGLVHANAAFTFRSILNVTDPVLLEKLGKYWQARFGAYPVLWTTAQEVDPGHEFNDYWHRIAKAIYDNDTYHQPLTAHMEGGDAGNTGWGDKEYHSWFGVQPSNLQKDGYQTFWEYNATKPYVAYETGYEFNRVTTDEARSTPYRAFSNGAFGFGYGVQGVWAINDSTDSWLPYGPYYRWFDGLNAAAGSQMTHFKNFYESLQWWKLTPAFRDTTYADFTGKDHAYLLRDGNKTYVAYFAEPNTATGTLKQMASTVYKAEWYNTRTGEYTLISEQVTPVNGQWAIPPKPDNLDWVLLVTSSQSALAPKLVVSSANQSTTINLQHGTLQLSAAVNVEHTAASVDWEVSNVDGSSTDAATIDQNGLLTALKNGVVRVTATQNVDGQLSASKTIIITRQDKAAPPAKAQSLTIIDGGNESFGNQQMLPVFTPNNTWDQRVEWAVFEQDGVTPTDKALISPFGVLTLLKEGHVKIVATALDGSGVTGSYDYTIQFTITNPLFVGATATASSSNYGNDYTPVKAILSNHGSFAGWSSGEGTTYNNPQWLQVEFAQPTVLNHIDVYTTESYFKMRDFDVQYWKDGQWVNLYSVTDNTNVIINIRFAELMTTKIRVICYVGDTAGITRIDSIEVYNDASAYGKLYAEPPPGWVLVSQGAPVTPYNGMIVHDGVQSNLTDGNLGTLSGSSTEFIDLYLDLGQKKSLGYVTIHYARHWNKTNKVYVSDDAVNWTEVVSGDGGIGEYEYLQNTTTTSITDHNVFGAMLPANTTGRYVRISSDQVYVNINEIQVYSTNAPYVVSPSGMHLISQGAPVTPYNGMIIHDGVQSNLTDGNLGTLSGASTEFIDLYLDLGQKKSLDYVTIHYARHWNKTNKVYVSDDATNWTEVVSGDGGIGKYEYLLNTTTTSITNPNVFGALLPANTKGRYVRISSDQVYVNINEIQVYSKDAG
ncbi:discoidin domain-containing protein [Paenibacillus agaridevorans]|uniref:discoidin domain-containing protein n=1 Tax=Paenibacillus agaridevorans TaxID=171404 RepID=UPI001BE48B7D|nr:discoidin domain-containing protein [Paenibacillus agaridevorans]